MKSNISNNIVVIIFFCSLAHFDMYGQRIEYTEPIKLYPGINSKSEELMPLLTRDGRMLYFTRALHQNNTGGAEAGQDIWVSHKIDSGWTIANNNFPHWNNIGNNAIVGISADGRTVYLLNAYSKHAKKNRGIAFSRFDGKSWTDPEVISIKGTGTLGYKGFYMNKAYDILLISMEGEFGKEDLFVSLKDENGIWQKPRNLGPTINTSGFEISPFLTEDKKTMYFSSDGHDGFGDADIYKVDRLYDSWEVWSLPENLGPEVNSEKFEAYFTLKDSIAHFTSNRGSKSADIYWTKMLQSNQNRNSEIAKELLAEAKSILLDLNNSSEPKELVESKFLNFRFNAYQLESNHRNQIDRLLEKINKSGKLKIELSAVANDLDDKGLNDELSFKRMESVREYINLKTSIETDIILLPEKAVLNKSGVKIDLFKI